MGASVPRSYRALTNITLGLALHCKRVAYNAGWLESLNLSNVTLSATPITAVHPHGLLTSDGVVHDFDIIVWATGFDVSGTGVGLNHGVKGEEGRDLSEMWEEMKGAQAFLAVAVAKVSFLLSLRHPKMRSDLESNNG
jgi:cation diffusion facilitator CzcD-associated flavoprotein CzcO